MDRRTQITGFAALVLTAGVASPAAAQMVLRVNNTNRTQSVKLSDVYAFSGANNTGVRTEVMPRGFQAANSRDDRVIAINGHVNVTLPAGTQSVTISFKKNGQERESDMNVAGMNPNANLAWLDGIGGGREIAVACADTGGAVPDVGSILGITNGRIDGGQYDWLTVYDVTDSGGFIVRNPITGAVLSPRLSTGSVETLFHYSLETLAAPAPGSLALLGCGLLASVRRRRL